MGTASPGAYLSGYLLAQSDGLSDGEALPSAVAGPAVDAWAEPGVDEPAVDAAVAAWPLADWPTAWLLADWPADACSDDALVCAEPLGLLLQLAVGLLDPVLDELLAELLGALAEADGLAVAVELTGVERLILWVGGRELTGGRTLVTSTTTGSVLSWIEDAPSR